ncbi:SUF system Fe-S cluster assembly protein [Luteithermobacter gelatinilyticus]|uniref:SUF system Fe-S cluster assembly protein n=1 Tax=Luteithermobacter gelatinilyticus TaxID=2582913 RepID=UPI001105AF0F|nr:SUF system Fe-S cluster assembly protein [Luteithermobacter gelatinilyticus]|tara:strand:+ start:8682 stop:9143 length:462 start_codon:yes stop_codon:yes gene_type:complete
MSYLDGFLNKKSKPAETDGTPEEENKTAGLRPEGRPAEETHHTRGKPLTDEEKRTLGQAVVEVLREIYDPEIPVNIYELGLVYDVVVSDYGDVNIVMTLTTPHCPVAESMPGEVEMRVREVENIGDVKVDLVWDPPWDMSMMSEAARLEMGFM